MKKMERIYDILGYKDLKIYQDTSFFSFSLDSIILANYSTIRQRDYNIVDFCTGNGVIPIILTRRCNKHIDAVEIQEKLYDLACRSVELNELNDRITVINDDVKNFSINNMNKYDLVLCNPPYFKNLESSTKNISKEKMIARHEIFINLDEVCHSANLVLKDNGTFSMIHRTDRLIDVITSMKKYKIEPKRIMFVYENVNSDSTLFLIEGQKNGKAGLKIEKPYILYNEDNTMTDDYENIQLEVNV